MRSNEREGSKKEPQKRKRTTKILNDVKEERRSVPMAAVASDRPYRSFLYYACMPRLLPPPPARPAPPQVRRPFNSTKPKRKTNRRVDRIRIRIREGRFCGSILFGCRERGGGRGGTKSKKGPRIYSAYCQKQPYRQHAHARTQSVAEAHISLASFVHIFRVAAGG